ncbi:MAG: peptide-methionine (S)-S-oxide reductase MsrA [Flavobacteriaceae bacterium]|nr:peptide-methionine (S)-S-oxide reductase MsrA [Flavobacteriaceae bacterium]
MIRSIVFILVLSLFPSLIYKQNNNKEYKFMHKSEITTFGGGCFWCTEAIFEELNGVLKVESGYSGGAIKNPSYEDICTSNTGHAEVIHITFNPKKVDFRELLDVFFATHNPTTLNRQGADVGTQYRSVIFYHNENQRSKALKFIAALEKDNIFNAKIVTEVTKFEVFYKATENHQDFYKNNPNNSYCNAVLNPKLLKFRKQFKERLKKGI